MTGFAYYIEDGSIRLTTDKKLVATEATGVVAMLDASAHTRAVTSTFTQTDQSFAQLAGAIARAANEAPVEAYDLLIEEASE